MISTTTIKRMTTAEVAVEHPDDWTDAQVTRAVKNRAIDVAARASMWSANDRTEIAGTEVGVDYRDGMEDGDFKPEPVQLGEEDLGGDDADEEAEDEAAEEPEVDEPAADGDGGEK